MIVTLDLPEKIAAHLMGLDEAERNNYALAAFSRYDETQSGDAADHAELIAGVNEGLADCEAGRTKPLAQYINEQRLWWQERDTTPVNSGK